MSQPSSAYQRQLFVLFLLAVVVAGKTIRPCLDYDTWWHLRVGQYIVAEQRIPDHDPFSRIGQEEHVPWLAYSWLYELGLFGSYQLGGVGGVLALRRLAVMLSWGGVAWFSLVHCRNSRFGMIVLALVTVSLLPFSLERPWHFSIFFTTLTFHAVFRVRDGADWRRFLWLVPVYMLWANLHIQFVMGFAVLGLAWLAVLIDGFIRGDPAAKKAASGLFGLGLACSLGTLATPFYVRLYLVIWQYASQTAVLAYIPEAQPLRFKEVIDHWYNWPLVLLVGWAAISSVRRGFRAWDLLFLASACYFGIRMQRDLWYGVLAAATVVLRERDGDDAAPSEFSAKSIVAVAAAAIVVVTLAWDLALSRENAVAETHEKVFPVGAVQFVRESRPPGPLFNHFDWGGYLIWELPEYPVSMDGRTNLYGEPRLVRLFDTWEGEHWEDDTDLLQAGVIIAPIRRGNYEFPLTKIMREQNQRWRIVYEDDTAVVFVPIK